MHVGAKTSLSTRRGKSRAFGKESVVPALREASRQGALTLHRASHRRIPRGPTPGATLLFPPADAWPRRESHQRSRIEASRGFVPWPLLPSLSRSIHIQLCIPSHCILLYLLLLALHLSLCVPSARREGSGGGCLARGWRRGRTRWTWPSTWATRCSTAPSTASSRSAPSAPAGWSPRTPSTASTGTNVTPNYLRFFAGDISKRQLEETLKKMCKEGAYWGAVAGVYVGMEYGVERVRGDRDWKNALLGGIATGALVSAASNNKGNKIVQDAITGGAIATAVEFINYLT